MYFLARDPLFDTEKPYSLRFPPQGDLPQSNIKHERHSVAIKSLRDVPNLGLDERGFEVLETQTNMSYEDFADETKIRSVYLPEVRANLIKKLGARHVHVLDFAVWVPPRLCKGRRTKIQSGPSTRSIVSDLDRRRVQT